MLNRSYDYIIRDSKLQTTNYVRILAILLHIYLIKIHNNVIESL